MEKLKKKQFQQKTVLNRILIGGILMLIFHSCSSEKEEFTMEIIPFYYDSCRKDGLVTLIKSYPYYDSTLYKEGELKLYYYTGELKEISTWKDNHLINECRIFYKNGTLREYFFYNPLGTLCYRRSYNEDGVLIKNIGRPFIYSIIGYTDSIKIGDTIITQIYIASPPHCIHSIYGIYEDFNSDEYFEQTKPYIYETSMTFTEEGEYGLPFELEFEDTITGIKRIYKKEIPYSVKK